LRKDLTADASAFKSFKVLSAFSKGPSRDKK
jgi:hypothetical protein